MLISISRERFTVLFEASPWRGEANVVYTEYVYADTDDEQDALKEAVRMAARRVSDTDNHDFTMVMAQMQRTKKLLAVADGFVSMTIGGKIKRRAK